MTESSYSLPAAATGTLAATKDPLLYAAASSTVNTGGCVKPSRYSNSVVLSVQLSIMAWLLHRPPTAMLAIANGLMLLLPSYNTQQRFAHNQMP